VFNTVQGAIVYLHQTPCESLVFAREYAHRLLLSQFAVKQLSSSEFKVRRLSSSRRIVCNITELGVERQPELGERTFIARDRAGRDFGFSRQIYCNQHLQISFKTKGFNPLQNEHLRETLEWVGSA
jgi:hypothetical protein